MHTLPDGIPTGIDDDLAELSSRCREIELTGLPEPVSDSDNSVATTAADALAARAFRRNLGCAWRINSFSSLTRDVHQVARGGEKPGDSDPIFGFPAGSQVGLLVHQLLEQIDFTGDIAFQGKSLAARLAPLYGLDQTGYAARFP